MKRALVAAFLFLAPLPAWAHEVRPGYLEMRQIGPESFRVFWKVPAKGNLRLRLVVRYPEGCTPAADPVGFQTNVAYTERYLLKAPGGLVGHEIGIEGLTSTMTDVLVRIVREDGSVQVERLTPGRPTFTVSDAPSTAAIAVTYLVIGVEHILLGIDHLLFVFALLLLVKGWRRLVATVTAFTLAHSVTLGAAALGFVTVPQQPVEAIIALSIVFVAVEIIRVRQGRESLTERKPWIVALTFGLLHGFGFAGALSEVGLPEQAIPLALLLFNLGVEAGQLLFVGGVVLLGAAWHRVSLPRPAWAAAVSAYAIGSLAAFWCIERVLGFV